MLLLLGSARCYESAEPNCSSIEGRMRILWLVKNSIDQRDLGPALALATFSPLAVREFYSLDKQNAIEDARQTKRKGRKKTTWLQMCQMKKKTCKSCLVIARFSRP